MYKFNVIVTPLLVSITWGNAMEKKRTISLQNFVLIISFSKSFNVFQ